MKWKLGRCVFSAVVLIACTGQAPAAVAAKDGRAMIKESDRQLKSHSEKTGYRMEIVGADGNVEQTRTFVTYYKRDSDGVEHTLQKFTGPPVFQGTGLLIVNHPGGQSDIWIYLPSSRLIRRVAGQEKSNQYMGTEFSYDDFEGYQISQYDFKLTGERPCGDRQTCHLIEAKPATKAEKRSSGYTKKVYWLEERSLYPVRIEYYNKEDKLEKVLVSTGMHQVNHYWRPTRQVMTNRLDGRATRLAVTKQEVDQGLQNYYVSKRFLRR
ncbi:MAG TPA: outer membrane lipoprotein-sorting protein [Gammaproteobacteria bacterium]|nr:outer membrane lipoprotein-sorting protein [Gammaproteobacteria bacterium]